MIDKTEGRAAGFWPVREGSEKVSEFSPRHFQIRTIQTLLTDKQLNRHGLFVAANPRDGSLWVGEDNPSHNELSSSERIWSHDAPSNTLEGWGQLQSDFKSWILLDYGDDVVGPTGCADIGNWLAEGHSGSHRSRPSDSPSWWARLSARIEQLGALAVEEDLSFSEASAASALQFARALKRARQPGAFLLGNGNIRLLWTTPSEEQVGLQFRSKDDIQFVLFKLRGDRLTYLMGSETPDGVMQTIAGMGIMHVLEP